MMSATWRLHISVGWSSRDNTTQETMADRARRTILTVLVVTLSVRLSSILYFALAIVIWVCQYWLIESGHLVAKTVR